MPMGLGISLVLWTAIGIVFGCPEQILVWTAGVGFALILLAVVSVRRLEG